MNMINCHSINDLLDAHTHVHIFSHFGNHLAKAIYISRTSSIRRPGQRFRGNETWSAKFALDNSRANYAETEINETNVI